MPRRTNKPASPTTQRPTHIQSSTPLPKPVAPIGDLESVAFRMDATRIERAAAALKAARLIEPTLTAGAKRLTGSDIRVVFDPNVEAPSTDGKVIRLIPPIGLGDHVDHDRLVCGDRDPVTDKMKCEACDRMDRIFSTFIHETAHIVHGSFDSLTDEERRVALDRILRERKGSFAERARILLETSGDIGFMPVATMISPYLPMLLNCMEDARVNNEAMVKMPGLRRSFNADVREVMTNGVEDANGDRHPWSERGRNAQAMIGSYLVAAGLADMLQYLDEEIQELYNDRRLRMVVEGVNFADSVSGSFEVAWLTFEALVERGFLRREKDDDDPQGQAQSPSSSASGDEQGQAGSDPESQSSEPQQASSDDDKSGNGNGPEHDKSDDESDDPSGSASSDDKSDDAAGEESDDAAGEDQSDGTDDASGGGSPGSSQQQEAADEDDDIDALLSDLKVLMGHVAPNMNDNDRKDMIVVDRQLDTMDAPSIGVSSVLIHQQGKVPNKRNVWHENNSFYAGTPSMDELRDELAVGATIREARLIFAENRASHMTRNLRHGQLNPSALHRVPLGDDKVFRRRKNPDSKDYYALLGLDISGSTKGTRLGMIRKVGWSMGEVFSRTGVKFAMYAHTGFPDQMSRYAEDGQSATVDLYEIKAENEPWNQRTQDRVRLLNAAGANLDGHTLEQYRKLAQRSNATERMIFYLTDGDMPLSNEREETVVLKREIETCARLGIRLIGIGVNTDSPKRHGLDTIRIDRVEELPQLIKDVGARLTC